MPKAKSVRCVGLISIILLFNQNILPGQAEDQIEPPRRVLVIGASMSDRMGGPLSGVPKWIPVLGQVDLAIKTNESPGERIFDNIKNALKKKQIQAKTQFIKHTMFRTSSDYHYSWIKRKLNQDHSNDVDMIFALDLFYKDFKDLGNIEELPKLEKKRKAKIKEINTVKTRIVDILERFASHSHIVWIGSPLCGDYIEKDGKIIGPSYPAGKQGHEWLEKVIEGKDSEFPISRELAEKIHIYDIRTAFDQLKIEGYFDFDLSGKHYRLPKKEIIADDDWHPNPHGNKIIANILMEKTSSYIPEWSEFLEPIPFE